MHEIDTFVAVAEAQRLLLLYKLEALAFPQRTSGSWPDRLEDKRRLAEAIVLYASLKDHQQSRGARGPPPGPDAFRKEPR